MLRLEKKYLANFCMEAGRRQKAHHCCSHFVCTYDMEINRRTALS
jgi:hypothetical protein